jgi:hypothetical protein
VIADALDAMFASGAWAVLLDDLQYLTDELRLGPQMQTLLLQARSIDMSLMLSTQRPRHVPVVVWNQCTHLFIFGTKDADDLRRLGGLGGLDGRIIRNAVAALDTHECLYVNTRSGHLYRLTAPRLGRG